MKEVEGLLFHKLSLRGISHGTATNYSGTTRISFVRRRFCSRYADGAGQHLLEKVKEVAESPNGRYKMASLTSLIPQGKLPIEADYWTL